MNAFSERLKQAMELREISVPVLSERIGINRTTLYYYLNGRMIAKQKILYKIAEELNVSETWLMGLDVPMEREMKKEEHDEALLLFSKLTKKEKELVIQVMKTMLEGRL